MGLLQEQPEHCKGRARAVKRLPCSSPELPELSLLLPARAGGRHRGESTGESQHQNSPAEGISLEHPVVSFTEAGAAMADTYMVDGVFQVEDPILDRVADVVLGVHHGGGQLLISTALGQLLVLWDKRVSKAPRGERAPKSSTGFPGEAGRGHHPQNGAMGGT